MNDRYYDDFNVGDRFISPGVKVTESMIIDFALHYDPQPFHVDPLAAKDSMFGGLVASGFQTMALTFRMFYQANIINACSLGSPGIDELRWLAPVFPDDTIHAEVEVLEMRPSSSKPDRGVIIMRFESVNQKGETVMRYRGVQIVIRKTAET